MSTGALNGSKFDWPVYFAENLILGNKNSAVGIATLWSPKEFFAKKLNAADYLVLGQLYSFDGINPLIRNILANPQIRTIILCGLDRIGSGEVLLKFMQHGVNKNWQVVGKEQAVVDSEIPHADLESLRKNVEVIDLRNELNPKKIQGTLATKKKLKIKPWAQAKIFPNAQIQSAWYPSEGSSYVYRGKTVAETWPKILHGILRFGEIKPAHHGSKQQELLNVVSVITAEDPQNPQWSTLFPFYREQQQDYLKQILTPTPLASLSYTYGQRLRNFKGVDQIAHLIKVLKKSAHSRQAFATTWDVEVDIKSSHPPCLISLQAIIKYAKLHLTAYFRSNDMYRAWPQNALGLRVLQQEIATSLKKKLGLLTIISASAHIYEENLCSSRKVVEKLYPNLPCEQDPRGNYLIRINKQKFIEVIHQSPQGEKIDHFRGKTARELMNKIAADEGVSVIIHALDLGAELQKAEIALKRKIDYTQDRPLNF